ncbi:MAG TPA: hypothetical protein VEL11_12435 [Candidatus Bathyarchaeia archaeon]|nr:hypothetical protein [Candidatus Bathyarchaeia archaeon]
MPRLVILELYFAWAADSDRIEGKFINSNRYSDTNFMTDITLVVVICDIFPLTYVMTQDILSDFLTCTRVVLIGGDLAWQRAAGHDAEWICMKSSPML